MGTGTSRLCPVVDPDWDLDWLSSGPYCRPTVSPLPGACDYRADAGGPAALPPPVMPGEDDPSGWFTVDGRVLAASVARYLRACGHPFGGRSLGLTASGALYARGWFVPPPHPHGAGPLPGAERSEEHTSELQSR